MYFVGCRNTSKMGQVKRPGIVKMKTRNAPKAKICNDGGGEY